MMEILAPASSLKSRVTLDGSVNLSIFKLIKVR